MNFNLLSSTCALATWIYVSFLWVSMCFQAVFQTLLASRRSTSNLVDAFVTLPCGRFSTREIFRSSSRISLLSVKVKLFFLLLFRLHFPCSYQPRWVSPYRHIITEHAHFSYFLSQIYEAFSDHSSTMREKWRILIMANFRNLWYSQKFLLAGANRWLKTMGISNIHYIFAQR